MNYINSLVASLLITLSFVVGLGLGLSEQPKCEPCLKCPAHVPCAVPKWDRDPETYEEEQARQLLMREMQEECGHKMQEARREK